MSDSNKDAPSSPSEEHYSGPKLWSRLSDVHDPSYGISELTSGMEIRRIGVIVHRVILHKDDDGSNFAISDSMCMVPGVRIMPLVGTNGRALRFEDGQPRHHLVELRGDNSYENQSETSTR